MEDTEAFQHASILTVEASYRIRLPQPLCNRVGWIVGDEPIVAWLLMGSSCRCRLFSGAEVDSDPDLRSLKDRIAEELKAAYDSPIEFQDVTALTLTLRLAQVQIKRHETSGWRLTLPRPIAAIMQLRPGESSLAVLIVQDHIELLTIEVLRASANAPLTNLF
jgi:hypothetical protein